MKKTYPIEVECANCANLMEEAVNKLDGVQDATVNFMTQKIVVKFDDDADVQDVMETVQKECQKVEPDCEISF